MHGWFSHILNRQKSEVTQKNNKNFIFQIANIFKLFQKITLQA